MTDQPATGADVEMAVYALLSAAQLKAARTELNLAGRLICERTSERF